MGRRLWTLFWLVLWFAGKLGPSATSAWKYTESVEQSPFGFVDDFFRHAWSPGLLVLATAMLISIWVLLPLLRFAKRHVFDAEHDKFAAQFKDSEQTASRQRFRWNLERAYRKFHADAKAGDLPQIIRGIRFPADFPPSKDVTGYALRVDWPEDNGKKFWLFCDWLYQNMLDASRNKQLDEALYSNFLNGRRIASKFWDDWARQMRQGLLSPEQIRAPIESNFCDIRALAISELAMAKVLGWDESRGKEHLFLLARDGMHISRPLMGRIRRTVAAILSGAAKWVAGDTTPQS